MVNMEYPIFIYNIQYLYIYIKIYIDRVRDRNRELERERHRERLRELFVRRYRGQFLTMVTKDVCIRWKQKQHCKWKE